MTPPDLAQVRAVAAAHGLIVIDEDTITLEAEAARMLPVDARGLGVAIAGDVLMVAMPQVPTPAEFGELEQQAGMPVTVALAPGAVYEALRSRAAAAFPPGAPRALGPVLAEAVTAGASDVLLQPGDVPRMRRDGAVVTLGRFPRLSARDVEDAAAWFTGRREVPEAGIRTVATHDGARWRVMAHRVGGHMTLTAHHLPQHPPRLEDLGLPSPVVELAQARSGLVVFAGPPGSGTTTSAAAFLDRINATRQAHLVTVEEVTEYRHQPRSCAVTQREVGPDVATVALGLAQASGQGADVVLVGELHGAPAWRAALDAAQAGLLVVATMHATPSAEAVLHRLLASFPEDEQPQVRGQLAACLRAVVAQILVPSTAEAGARQAVCEVLLGGEAVAHLLRQGRAHEVSATVENQVRAGMTSLDRSLAYYVAAGRLEETVARAMAPHPDRFNGHLRRAPGARPTEPDPAADAQHASLGQPPQ